MSPRLETDDPLTQKSLIIAQVENSKQGDEPPCQELNSEELLEQKQQEEKVELRQAYEFLKLLAKKLKRSVNIVNSAMVYFLKYTRIYSFTNINKYLVASSCFLLAAKCRNEPIPLEYLVELYIYCEAKRANKDSNINISRTMKDQYADRIKQQEFELVYEIGFDTEIDLPYTYIAQFATTDLGKAFARTRGSKCAYMFMNDSFLTTCSLYYPPKYVAAACLLMAYIYIKTKDQLPGDELNAFEGSEWLASIDETLDLPTIIEVKDEIKKCYARKASSS